MKSISLMLLNTFVFCHVLIAQNIGIGTTTPHASAQLDVTSTTKGLLIPRMTTLQRGAIASPAQGLMVYDTDTKTNWYHNGTVWTNMAVGGGGFTLPYLASVNLNTDVFRINNAGTGPAINGQSTYDYGIGVKGTANGAYGYGVYAYSDQANGVAVYGDAGSATAVKGYSVGGFGVDARSTNNSAIKASIMLGANANPVIQATHAGAGTALYGKSTSGYGLEVEGKVKISGGNTSPAIGAVLTSDASGNATWKVLPSGLTVISSAWLPPSDPPSRDTSIDGTLTKVYYVSAPDLTSNLISTASINIYMRVGGVGPYELPYISNAGGRANAVQAFFMPGKIGITRPTFNETGPNNINLPATLEFRYTIIK